MALGESVGTVFIEMALETAKVAAGLKSVENDTVKTAASIESNFHNKMGSLNTVLYNKFLVLGGIIASAFSIREVTRFAEECVRVASAADRMQAKLVGVLNATGHAAGLTAEDIEKVAVKLGRVNAIDEDVVISASALLLTFKKIPGEAFEPVIQAAMDMSAVMGQSLPGAARMLGRALEDPARGMMMLRRMNVIFSESERRVIKDLMEQGQIHEAQQKILDKVNSSYKDVSKTLADTYAGNLKNINDATEDFHKSLGRVITRSPFVQEVMKFIWKEMDKLTESVDKNRLGWIEWTKGPIVVMTYVGTAAIGLAAAVDNAFTMMNLGVKAVTLGFIELARVILYPMQKIEQLGNWLGIFKDTPLKDFKKDLDEFAKAAEGSTAATANDLQKRNEGYGKFAGKLGELREKISSLATTEKVAGENADDMAKRKQAATEASIAGQKKALAYEQEVWKRQEALSASRLSINDNETQHKVWGFEQQKKLELDNIDFLEIAKKKSLETWYANEKLKAEKEAEFAARTAVLDGKKPDQAADLANKMAILDNQKTIKENANIEEITNKRTAAKEKTIDIMSDLYKTIGDYSKASLASQVAQIEKKYTEDGRWAKATKEQAIVLENAKNTEIFNLRNSSQQALINLQLSYLELIKGPYSEAYKAMQQASLTAQAALLENQMKNAEIAFDKEAWLTQKQNEELAKRLEAQASYYMAIGGMEDKALGASLAAIAMRKKLNVVAFGDEKAANIVATQSKIKLEQDIVAGISNRYDTEHKFQAETIKNAMSVFDNASALMNKESKEYHLMQEMKKAAQIAELAMSAQKSIILITQYFAQNAAAESLAITNAAGAIAAQATVPVGGFAMAAAMTGLMASVLGMAGIAFGGGGGAAAGGIPILLSSTVLGGAAGQGSESNSNAYKILEDTYTLEYRELTGIHNSMKDLNKNITGVITGVIRGGASGTPFGANFGESENSIKSIFEKLGATAANLAEIGIVSAAGYGALMSGLAISPAGWAVLGAIAIDKIIGLGITDRVVGFISNTLFGSTNIFAEATGLMISKGGKEVRSYSDIVTERSWSVFGGGGSDERSTALGAVNAELTNLFSGPQGIYTSLQKSMEILAIGLGGDLTAASSHVFEELKINLQGMDTEQITKTINDKISEISDVFAQEVLSGAIRIYQQVGEGLAETAVRLLANKVVVLDTLSMTGQAFVGSISSVIAFSESIVSLAGDLDALRTAAETYYDKFFADTEKQTRLQNQLIGSMADVNQILPAARDGYRKLLEGLDLTTQADVEAYVTMLKLSESADKYYTALEDVAKKQEEVTLSLQKQAQTITSWLEEVNRSVALAPSTSASSWTQQYQNLKNAATSGNEADTNAFLTYSKEYLGYMRVYSNSYKEVFDKVMTDVQGLQMTIQDKVVDAQLQAAQALADAANLLSAAGVSLINAAVVGSGADLSSSRATGYKVPSGNGWDEMYASPGQTLQEAISNAIIMGGIKFASGGYANTPSIFGDAGGEWAVPTYEPERSSFLRDAPPAFWNNLGAGLRSGGNGEEITIIVPVNIDGNQMADVTAKYIPRNANLSEAIRRVA